MKVDVFCAWGDGPDVGINLTRTEEEAKGWQNPHLNWFLDFTAVEARELATKLLSLAEHAEKMDREYAEHIDHGRGTAEDGPDDPDCPCRGTEKAQKCAQIGCGFCRCET